MFTAPDLRGLVGTPTLKLAGLLSPPAELALACLPSADSGMLRHPHLESLTTCPFSLGLPLANCLHRGACQTGPLSLEASATFQLDLPLYMAVLSAMQVAKTSHAPTLSLVNCSTFQLNLPSKTSPVVALAFRRALPAGSPFSRERPKLLLSLMTLKVAVRVTVSS